MAVDRDARRDEQNDPRDQRSPGQRDRDRILYTSAMRRLVGVTQVVSPSEGHIVHNRLTHTVEVAQIARRLAEKVGAKAGPELVEAVGGVDPDVVEAAALAHDLGHPPFGHIAESELDKLLSPILPEGFEGNAQSFRIVTKLAVRRPQMLGLNLTRATLNAILKYPWFRRQDKKRGRKWGAYRTEKGDFDFARAGQPAGDDAQSAEAGLMDWADDIAYSVHDVEDFYRAGLIPLDRLARDAGERDRFAEKAAHEVVTNSDGTGYTEAELVELFRQISVMLPSVDGPYVGTIEQRALLRQYTAGLIGRYVGFGYEGAVTLREPTADDGCRVLIDRRIRMEVAMLKQLTWQYVIYNPALAAQQYGYRRVIRELFEIFMDAAADPGMRNLLPVRCQEWLRRDDERADFESDDQFAARAVADLIASMTEQEALGMHRRLTGASPGSVTDIVVR
jgi:dGTPase